MDSDRIFTVKLHEHKELTTECAEVLNEEWPRSLTARLVVHCDPGIVMGNHGSIMDQSEGIMKI